MDSFGLAGSCVPHSHLLPVPAAPSCVVCLREWVMRHTTHLSSGAARAWHRYLGVRWERFQGRVARHYYTHVTWPVRFWRACGCPAEYRPSLPWWQPFVWRWLVVTGWLR
jgi:hypothetical protein